MSLHLFGLVGVVKPSHYEANPAALEASAAAFDLKCRLLANAPNLSLLVASDPDNHAQARARLEVLAILESAREIMGLTNALR